MNKIYQGKNPNCDQQCKTIKFSSYESWKCLVKDMETKGFEIDTNTQELITKLSFPQNEKNVNIVFKSVADMGYKQGATIDEIYTLSILKKLRLCPSEIGPQLRLQYYDQPYSEDLYIGMKPIISSDGMFLIFKVGSTNENRYLNVSGGFRDNFYSPKSIFVFTF